jgi:hypothetical protein
MRAARLRIAAQHTFASITIRQVTRVVAQSTTASCSRPLRQLSHPGQVLWPLPAAAASNP